MSLDENNETSAGRFYEWDAMSARPVVCVLLADAEFPRWSVLLAAIQRRLPGFANACSDHADAGPAFVGRIDGKHCFIAFCDEPHALDPDSSCIASAWWWRDAWEKVERSKAYVLVCMVDPDEPARCWSVLSKLAAAVVETSTAIGVLWPPADAVWPADEFRAEVDRAGDELPIRMLVSVKVAQDESSASSPAFFGHTWGLAAFDLMEIEMCCFEGDPIEMIGFLLDMASYLIERGPVIGHGDTCGHNGDHKKFTVRHEPSTLVAGRTVHRLYLAATRVS